MKTSDSVKGVKLLYERSDSQLLKDLAIYPSGVKMRVMAQPQTLDPFSGQICHLFLLSVRTHSYSMESRDSSVGIAAGWTARIRFPA
jgi:hypothetical protein